MQWQTILFPLNGVLEKVLQGMRCHLGVYSCHLYIYIYTHSHLSNSFQTTSKVHSLTYILTVCSCTQKIPTVSIHYLTVHSCILCICLFTQYPFRSPASETSFTADRQRMFAFSLIKKWWLYTALESLNVSLRDTLAAYVNMILLVW